MSDTAVLILVTFADRAEAHRIGRTLVDEGLAACVNILGDSLSIYRWEGKVEEADEVMAIIKTRPASADRVVRRLTDLHSYDLPVIERLNATVSPGVAAWLQSAASFRVS